MKKFLVLFGALFLLSACNTGQDSTKDSSTKATATATTKSSSSSSTKETANSDKSSGTNSSDSSTAASSSSKTDSTHGNHAMSAMQELQANYPNEKFPDPVTISGGKNIGITATEAEGVLTVNYYVVNEDTPFNDPALNGQTIVAQYKRQNYASNAEAQSAVGQNFDPNGRQVDLGHKITGYQTAGAGSSFIVWKEGNWSLGVQANNLEQEDPLPLAKQVVEYLEGAFLPVPHAAGQISLRVAAGDSQSNRVVWQDNQTVHTIMNGDSMSSLKMAVSMAK